MKSFIRFLVFSNILVAFCVLALALSTELLLGAVNYKISQFVFFATLFTYNFQRIVRIWRGVNHVRKKWLDKHKIAIISLTIIGGILSFYLFLEFQTKTQIVIVISGVLSVLYPFGLRKIPFVKIFVISLIWMTSTILLLVVENNLIVNQNIIMHLGARFLFVFAIAIPFDIRDLKHDDSALKTIPLIFGQSKARLIAVVALFIAEVIAIIQYMNCWISFQHLIAIISLLFLSLILVIKSNRDRGEMFYSFWVESLSIALYLFLSLSTLMF